MHLRREDSVCGVALFYYIFKLILLLSSLLLLFIIYFISPLIGSHTPSPRIYVNFWTIDAVVRGAYHGCMQSPQNYSQHALPSIFPRQKVKMKLQCQTKCYYGGKQHCKIYRMDIKVKHHIAVLLSPVCHTALLI